MKSENLLCSSIRSRYQNNAAAKLLFFFIIITGFTAITVSALLSDFGKASLINYSPVFISCFTTVLLCLYIDWIEKYKTAFFTYGWLSLWKSFLIESLTWFIVALSNLVTAAIFTVFPIILSAFHGHLYKSSLKNPYSLIVSILAASVAFTLNHHTDHLVIYSISLPIALGMNIFMGIRACRMCEAKKNQDTFRDLIDKEIIGIHSETIDRVIKILKDFREHNHDAVNEYTGLMLLLPGFIKIAQSENLEKENMRKAAAIAKCIQQCLQSLQQIMKNRHSIEIRNQLQSILVYPCEILEDLILEFKQKFPSIHFLKNFPDPVKNVTIPFFGGDSALKEVYYNIIQYACIENKRGTNCVIIETNFDSEVFFEISVSDNGRCFSKVELETPLINYPIKNVLYTSLQILKTNGGSLIRKNRNDTSGTCIVTKLRMLQDRVID